MFEKLNFPTKRHEEYILKLKELCIELGLDVILIGSLKNGTATKYSDIDVLIFGEVTESDADKIVSCYGIPVMTNYTENPKGIFILVYKDGLSIDLDFRNTVLKDELNNSFVLLDGGNKVKIDNKVQRQNVKSSFLPERKKWYKDFRLGHRALIKYLSNKKEAGIELLEEMKTQFAYLDDLEYTGEFKNDIKLLVEKIVDTYNVEAEYLEVIERLIDDL